MGVYPFFVLFPPNDGRAESRQRLGGSLADAGGGSQNECRPAIEPKHRPISLKPFIDRAARCNHRASLLDSTQASGHGRAFRPCSTSSRNFFTLASPA